MGTHEDQHFEPGIGGVIRTTDFDFLAQVVPGWVKEVAQLGHGPFSGGLSFGQTRRIQFGFEHWSPGMLIRGVAPAGAVVMGFPLTGQVRARIRGLELGEHHVGVVGRDQEIDFRVVGPCRVFVVAVPEDLLEAHAEALLGRPVKGLLTSYRINGGLSMAERQRQVEQLGVEALCDTPGRLKDPAVARWVENKLLDAFILGLPAQPGRNHLPGAVSLARRAEAYLQANLQAPLTIRDLCTALGTTERTLHLAFKTHFGTTPKAHLKMLRLNAVRRALRTAPPGTGVMDIATQWGFFHAGWLSQDYRRMFGESPSKALPAR